MEDHPITDLEARTAPSWTVPSVDGVEVAAYELGGTGPVLLVAHATGFLGTMYAPMAAEVGRRVVALDFRGHGSSTRPTNDDFGWDRMAHDVLAVVDHLTGDGEGGSIAGFGHSLGGGVLLLAERARPGTFSSLFLYEPIVFPDDVVLEGPQAMAGSARGRRATFPSRSDALERYAGRPPLSWMRPDVLRIYVRDGFVDQPDGTVALACRPDDEARTFEAEVKVRVSGTSSITVPVTVAVGHDEEGPNPARFGRPIADALPGGRLLVCDELGHLGPFEDPPTVADHLRRHLRRHDAT